MEKYTDQIFREQLKSRDYIVKNIKKFLKFHLKPKDFKNLDLNEDIYSMWFAENWITPPANSDGEFFGFNYFADGEDCSYSMNKEEYLNFIEFLNDPEIYMILHKK